METKPTTMALWVCVLLAATQTTSGITVATYPYRPPFGGVVNHPSSQQHLYRPPIIPHPTPHLSTIAQRVTQLPQQTVANPRIIHDLSGVPTVPPNILAASQHEANTQISVKQSANANPIVFVSYPGAKEHRGTLYSRSGVPAPPLRFPTQERHSHTPSRRRPKVAGTSRLPAISQEQHALGSIDRQYDSSEPQSVRGPLPAAPVFNSDYRALPTNEKQATSHASSGGSGSGGGHKSSGGGKSSGAKKGGHHHDTSHHTHEGKKGSEGKDRKQSEYSTGGGKKTSHHDSGSHGGEHDEYGGGGSEGGYKAGGHKKAAGFTKGFRDKYHKDEYHKQAKFWKDGHESGNYEKFGKKGASHYGGDGAHKKGETHHAGSSGSKHGKKGQTASGHAHADQSGYKGETGGKKQSSHGSEYAKKGGSQHSKKHGDAAFQ